MLYRKLTKILVQKGVIPSEEQDLYAYGFDILIYTIWSTVALLLIGFFLHRLLPTAIIITGFYTLQSRGGGYHADSHLGCFFTMVVGLLIGLLPGFFSVSPTFLWCILCCSASFLYLYPLVLHPHKQYLQENSSVLRFRSRLATVLLVCIAIIAVQFACPVYPFASCLMLSAVSRQFAICRLKRNIA